LGLNQQLKFKREVNINMSHELKLVVSIVAKEKSAQVIEAIEKAGAIKSTIMLGRGRSKNNPKLFFGMIMGKGD